MVKAISIGDRLQAYIILLPSPVLQFPCWTQVSVVAFVLCIAVVKGTFGL